MRKRLALFAALPLLFAAAPLHASGTAYEIVVEEWIETSGPGDYVSTVPPAELPRAIASYGPFRVIDATRAALVGVTGDGSPAAFAAMLRNHPGIATLEMIECPGTENDRANLQLGRMIRAAGLQTHVPRGGSVRSGAVELFLAGATRRIDEGAEFAVHAWMDETGHQAHDYDADSPENRKYLAYYREMGLEADRAAAFYAMTNSVPFSGTRWLDATEMRRWLSPAVADLAPAAPPIAALQAEPALAYLDLSSALP